MKDTLKLAILNTLIAISVHIYSTLNYYKLKFFIGHKSSCNINDTFNCDLVSASSYSSFLGIPLSLWGIATLTILLILLLVAYYKFTDHRQKVLRWSFIMASFIAFMSVIMGAISFVVLKTFCLTCLISYILSFTGFELIRRSQEANDNDTQGFIKSNLKYIIGLPLGTIIFALFTHQLILSSYQLGDIKKVVKRSISEWKSNPVVDFSTQPTLIYGPEDAQFVVVEFADFLCSHCKSASSNLDAFKKSHSNIQFKFYAFPLDGTCNPHIEKEGPGTSCVLAKATMCAGFESNKLGWSLHDKIFDAQESLYGQSSDVVNHKIKTWIEEEGQHDWEKISQCMNSEETHEKILAQAQLGDRAGITGTPTIFANGKRLPRGQLIPVLELALKSTHQ